MASAYAAAVDGAILFAGLTGRVISINLFRNVEKRVTSCHAGRRCSS